MSFEMISIRAKTIGKGNVYKSQSIGKDIKGLIIKRNPRNSIRVNKRIDINGLCKSTSLLLKTRTPIKKSTAGDQKNMLIRKSEI